MMAAGDPKPPFEHMLLDAKTSSENHRRFVERVAAAEVVYYLTNKHGTANSTSNDDDEIAVLPFWSDAPYAKRAALSFEDQFQVESISLFDFLYRWLPGMTDDGVLAGVNWNGDLCGDEVDPFELRTEIEGHMSSKLREEYEESYNRMTQEA
jgi:hypothetical protein